MFGYLEGAVESSSYNLKGGKFSLFVCSLFPQMLLSSYYFSNVFSSTPLEQLYGRSIPIFFNCICYLIDSMMILFIVVEYLA